jgi:hypothetical protein
VSARLRQQSGELCARAKALSAAIEEPVRCLLCDFVAVTDGIEIYARASRGSICEGCHRAIAAGELEYYLAAASSMVRLGLHCFCVMLDLRAFTRGEDDVLEQFVGGGGDEFMGHTESSTAACVPVGLRGTGATSLREEAVAVPTLPQLVRDKIDAGSLPCEAPLQLWAGHGTGQACSVCDAPIVPRQVEYELQYDARPPIRLHVGCHGAWLAERHRGI